MSGLLGFRLGLRFCLLVCSFRIVCSFVAVSLRLRIRLGFFLSYSKARCSVS